jgi:hypothetical protein
MSPATPNYLRLTAKHSGKISGIIPPAQWAHASHSRFGERMEERRPIAAELKVARRIGKKITAIHPEAMQKLWFTRV